MLSVCSGQIPRIPGFQDSQDSRIPRIPLSRIPRIPSEFMAFHPSIHHTYRGNGASIVTNSSYGRSLEVRMYPVQCVPRECVCYGLSLQVYGFFCESSLLRMVFLNPSGGYWLLWFHSSINYAIAKNKSIKQFSGQRAGWPQAGWGLYYPFA